MSKETVRFSFGRNWIEYVRNFVDEEKITSAFTSLFKYLPPNEYQGKVFIDVGCGSGIFSLAAIKAGCSKVISFDVDKQSISATNLVRQRLAHLIPPNVQWEIFEGSILDNELISQFKEQGDIVYSWGVLDHTGNMRQGLLNTAKLVKPNGYLILAIYNRAPSSEFWLKVKGFYNRAPSLVRKVMIYSTFSYIVGRRAAGILKKKALGQPHEPLLSRERGMSIFYDVIDWLGGYPYEFATFEEVQELVEDLGFKLVAAPTRLPSPPKKFLNRFSFLYTGNNEFVFKKQG